MRVATFGDDSEAELVRALRRLDEAQLDTLGNPSRRPEPPPLFVGELGDASEDDFDAIYNEPVQARDAKLFDVYPGGRVKWLGKKGRMFKATPGYTSPREDNIFYPDKLAAVVAALRAGRRIVSEAPLAHLVLIDADLVGRTQKAESDGRLWEYGIARPFTTGDRDLDRYLADPEDVIERERIDDDEAPRWRRAMDRRAASAERRKLGDLGRYWVRVRDGNHRLFGAFLAGEPHAWVRVMSRPDEAFPPGLLK